MLGKPLESMRMIVMHLGAGSSITAIQMVNPWILQWG
ncbi:hypothetical protein AAULR_17629, partial [Lacticaseibacillus rhamnosus MTCC 5462]